VDVEQIRAGMRETIARHGPWTAHDVELAPGVFTIDGRDLRRAEILRRTVQIVADLVPKPIAELRVLDLACMEGLYALEFALHGATVVGIEARDANLAKARFAQQALGLDNVEFMQGDVRALSPDAHGEFDVVVAPGILYHLDAPDVFQTLERIGRVCTAVAIVTTHVSLNGRERRAYGGFEYRGHSYFEHDPRSDPAERLARTASSLDNPQSFWLTPPSLANALRRSGFTSVYESLVPAQPGRRDVRTYVAVKGAEVKVRVLPSVNDVEERVVPESAPPRSRGQKWYTHPRFVPLHRAVPRWAKRAVGRIAR
jgi:ubiquinone/menaquinone biosynthesis C-methylase UbiE